MAGRHGKRPCGEHCIPSNEQVQYVMLYQNKCVVMCLLHMLHVFSVMYNCYGINVEYVTMKIWERNAS